MFESIKSIVRNVKSIDPEEIIVERMTTTEIQRLIINLNTVGQLFQLGEDSRGVRLDSIGGGYSALTVQIKQSQNKPFDRVTLNDTGDFYGSWRVTKEGKEVIITANPIKDQDNLFDRWGEDVVGLQEGSLLILLEAIKDEFIEDIRAKITA